MKERNNRLLEDIGKCSMEDCNNKATALIRTKGVCSRCFNNLKLDNIKRFKKRMDIPNSFEILKEEPKFKFKISYDEKTGRFTRKYLQTLQTEEKMVRI